MDLWQEKRLSKNETFCGQEETIGSDATRDCDTSVKFSDFKSWQAK